MARMTHTAFELKALREKIQRKYVYKDKKSFPVLVPKNVKDGALLKVKPLSIKDDNVWTNSAFYVLSSIISLSQKKRFKGGDKTKGYVSLNALALRKVLGQQSKIIIDTLENAGIVESDESYTVSVTSTGYRLTSKYRKSPPTFVTITNASLVKRYNKQAKLHNKELLKKLRDKAYLVKWFLNDKLKIDESKALKYLDLYGTIIKRHVEAYNFTKKIQDEILSHIDSSIHSSKNVLQNWHTRDITFDSKGERFYSSLTSIMSQLRCFISYDGQELVSFDIKNSQPFHLLLLLNPSFWSKPKIEGDVVMENLNPELMEYIKTNHTEQYNTTIMLLKEEAKRGKSLTNKGVRRLSDTSPHYPHEVATGKYYKFISDRFKGKHLTMSGFDPFGTKDLAKKELIRMLYFNPKRKMSPSLAYFQTFSKLYPSVAAVITLLKLRKYQDFSVLLQKVESTILLGHVCKKIFESNTKIPIFTIHDSILTTKEHSEQVEHIIRKTYSKIMGIEPELKMEKMTTKEAGKNFPDYIHKKIDKILFDIGHPPQRKAIFTPDDITDTLKSGLFEEKTVEKLNDVFVTVTYPW